MNVNDKIKQILIDKSISPSVFADEIGVQRSSISHILSGRNRPSFDIIQKVIRRYPDLGYDWIMEDEDSENQRAAKPATVRSIHETSQATSTHNLPVSNQRRTQPQQSAPTAYAHRTNEPPLNPAAAPELPIAVTQKAIERILIFYTDGTFCDYVPNR